MKQPWKALLGTVVVLAICEVILTGAAFVNMAYRRGVPKDIAAQRLLITRWFVSPFLPVDSRMKPYTGGRQRYLGELQRDSPAWTELIEPDGLLGSRLGRNITVFENSGLGDPKGSIYVTNDEGFASVGYRDFHYGLDHPAQCYRSIMVGGSTVFGWGSGTPDWNLPARLAVTLKRQDSALCEVINAGVPGYDSSQQLLYFASELIHYKPDLLIVYGGWTDEFDAEVGPAGPRVRSDGVNFFKTTEHLQNDGRLRESYWVLGSARLLAQNIVARAQAAARHTGVFWLIRGVARRLVGHLSSGRVKPQMRFDPSRMGIYERNLISILNFAGQNGVRVALFLQPIMWVDGRTPTMDDLRAAEPDNDSIAARQAFYADARRMFTRLRERYQKPGDVCIEDISQVLKDTPGTVYADSGHLGGRGNQIVADEMFKRLAACDVLRH